MAEQGGDMAGGRTDTHPANGDRHDASVTIFLMRQFELRIDLDHWQCQAGMNSGNRLRDHNGEFLATVAGDKGTGCNLVLIGFAQTFCKTSGNRTQAVRAVWP